MMVVNKGMARFANYVNIGGNVYINDELVEVVSAIATVTKSGISVEFTLSDGTIGDGSEWETEEARIREEAKAAKAAAKVAKNTVTSEQVAAFVYDNSLKKTANVTRCAKELGITKTAAKKICNVEALKAQLAELTAA